MDALKLIAAESVKNEIPEFGIGDTIKIGVNIREGDKERVQKKSLVARTRKHKIKGLYARKNHTFFQNSDLCSRNVP